MAVIKLPTHELIEPSDKNIQEYVSFLKDKYSGSYTVKRNMGKYLLEDFLKTLVQDLLKYQYSKGMNNDN